MKKGSRTIRIGKNAHIQGDVFSGDKTEIHSESNVVHQNDNRSISELITIYENLPEYISANAEIKPEDKRDLIAEISEVKGELEKGDVANEPFITRRLRNIRRMAPEILDVMLATWANPAAGIGVVAKKIADRMKSETDQATGAK